MMGKSYCVVGDSHASMEKANAEFIEGYRHQYSPNADMADDPEAEAYWMQMADFYEWPHIQYFDNLYHLRDLLQNSDFDAIHSAMKEEMGLRQAKVENRLCDIIRRVSSRKKY